MNTMLKLKKLINSEKIVEKPKMEKKEPEHLHKWKVVGKTYAPPNPMAVNKDMEGSVQTDSDTMQKSLFGVTTILWECETCGETKKEEMLGSDEDMLESVINKAELIGPQFIERRGKSFIISEWKPPSQDQNMIPVR